MTHLASIVNSPAVEVALTKVVEGGVLGYYEEFRKVVVPILDKDPGCDGHFISPLIENPQDQLLLINWKSVAVSKSLRPLLSPRLLTFSSRPTMKSSRSGRRSKHA